MMGGKRFRSMHGCGEPDGHAQDTPGTARGFQD
jgi:hypothetical protein